MEYIIGLPVSPSTKVSITPIEVTAVRLSYGGGMGGANKIYYCTTVNTSGYEPFYVLTTFLGEEIRVNPRFIVETYKRTIIKNVTDITQWRNYHKKECKSSIRTVYYEIKTTDTFKFVAGATNTKGLEGIYLIDEEKQ